MLANRLPVLDPLGRGLSKTRHKGIDSANQDPAAHATTQLLISTNLVPSRSRQPQSPGAPCRWNFFPAGKCTSWPSLDGKREPILPRQFGILLIANSQQKLMILFSCSRQAPAPLQTCSQWTRNANLDCLEFLGKIMRCPLHPPGLADTDFLLPRGTRHPRILVR